MRKVIFGILLILCSCSTPVNKSNIYNCLPNKQAEAIKKAHSKFMQLLKKEYQIKTIEDYQSFFEYISSSGNYRVPEEYAFNFEYFKENEIADTIFFLKDTTLYKNVDILWSKELIECVAQNTHNSDHETLSLRLKKNNNISPGILASSMQQNFNKIDFDDELINLWILIEFYIDPCIRQSIE